MFAPCEYLGHKFVDGGVIDNIPAGEVRKLGVDKIITVSFANDENHDPKNIYEVIFKSLDILFDARSYEAFNLSDLVLNLDLPEAKVFSRNKVDYCYNIGYVSTIAKMKEIKDMLKE